MHIPNPMTMIKEVALIINPIHPEELNITALSNEVTNQTVTPEEIPETAAERKIGMSEKSN